MTRREREVTDINEILKIMDACKIVHVGLVDGDQPYVLPMNYGYTYKDGKMVIYLHGAKKGYKYDLIEKNPKVCFEMECDVVPFEGKVACQYGNSYSCVMGKGKAVIVEDVNEKMQALSILMKCQTGGDFTFNEELVSIVNVIRIDVSEFSAKKRPVPEGLKK